MRTTTDRETNITQNTLMTEKIGELQRQIKEKENQLIVEQNLNSELKKNIAKIRFEKNFNKKKQLLFK